jgi:hypothetical protein
MINLINESSFKVGNNYNVIIKLENNIRYSNYNSWKIVRVTTFIKFIANDKIYIQKQINTIGRSAQTKQEALARASQDFKNQIKKIGLEKLLLEK